MTRVFKKDEVMAYLSKEYEWVYDVQLYSPQGRIGKHDVYVKINMTSLKDERDFQIIISAGEVMDIKVNHENSPNGFYWISTFALIDAMDFQRLVELDGIVGDPDLIQVQIDHTDSQFNDNIKPDQYLTNLKRIIDNAR